MDNAKKLYNGRKIIIDEYKNKMFSFNSRTHEDEDEDEYSPLNRLGNLVDRKRRELSYDLIQIHFKYQDLETMLKDLNK